MRCKWGAMADPPWSLWKPSNGWPRRRTGHGGSYRRRLNFANSFWAALNGVPLGLARILIEYESRAWRQRI